MITFFKKLKILFFSKDDMLNELLERCERLDAANTLLLEAIKDKNNLLKKYIKTSKNAQKCAKGTKMEVGELINSRAKDYGDFKHCALRYLYFKKAFESIRLFSYEKNADELQAVLRIVIDMWSVKLARLAYKETADTIADLHGYSFLLVRDLGIENAKQVSTQLSEICDIYRGLMHCEHLQALNEILKNEISKKEGK